MFQIYKELLPQLVAFERLHGCTDVQDMTVPCLYAEVLDEPDCAIVLENVQKKGYWVSLLPCKVLRYFLLIL